MFTAFPRSTKVTKMMKYFYFNQILIQKLCNKLLYTYSRKIHIINLIIVQALISVQGTKLTSSFMHRFWLVAPIQNQQIKDSLANFNFIRPLLVDFSRKRPGKGLAFKANLLKKLCNKGRLKLKFVSEYVIRRF